MEENRADKSLWRKIIPILGLAVSFWCQSNAVLAQWAPSGSDIYNTNTGNVGIGTTMPLYKLDVSGTMKGSLLSSNRNAVGLEYNILFNAANRYTVTQIGTAALDLTALFDGVLSPSYSVTGPSNSDPTVITIENLPATHTQAGAWVGWTSRYRPPIKFKIEGYDGYNNADIWRTFADYSTTSYQGADFLVPVATAGIYTKLRFTFYQASNPNDMLGISELFFIHPEAGRVYSGLLPSNMFEVNGNVGIGTTNPATKLEVGGVRPIRLDPNLGSIRIKGQSTSWATLYGFTSTNGTDLGGFFAYGGDSTLNWFNIGRAYNDGMFTILNSGNVGIGTTGPIERLTLGGIGTRAYNLSSTGGIVINWADSLGSTNYVGLRISAPYNSGTPMIGVVRMNRGTGNVFNGMEIGTYSAQPIRFITNATTENGQERMRITSSGEVGIGTAAPDPASKLTVAGNVTVTGNIAAKYQDVAEWVTSPKSMPAGTVVILDVEHSNQVLPSIRSYDTRVAGVISDMPGILLGEAGDGKVKVATTGRVKVKVDATKKPVQVGDLLVTSDKEGVAMKSEPLDLGGVPIHRPGTLIGKALEPLSEGEGEILVLLSLQ